MRLDVRAIEVANFMRHSRTELLLPECGVVAVTGENGAGKSTIVEAVAWAGWGKTIRGTPPWHKEGKLTCAAALRLAAGIDVTRTRKGTKTDVSWNASSAFDTAGKGQEALGNLVGDYDVWRRTHVFSSADATHFTLATDGERKRLIESFLGCDRFDPGLKKCREDAKAAMMAHAAKTTTLAVLESRANAAAASIQEAKKSIAAAVPPEEYQADEAAKPGPDYTGLLRDARTELSSIERQLSEMDQTSGGYLNEARNAKALLDRLRRETCPTCTQKIDPNLRAQVQAHIAAHETAAKAAVEKAHADGATLRETLDEIRAEVEALTKKQQAANVAKAERDQRNRNRLRNNAEYERLCGVRQRAEAELHDVQEQAVELRAAVDALALEMAELAEVERVLGLKGVRSAILGDSLAGIEAVANGWLARLRTEPLTLSLMPYSEKSGGGVKDSISLEIEGAGDGWGYKANSGGERRRVDIALLLGLGEVAAAATGNAPGTLFFDEVFDCLDESGVEAVADALADLAKDRCVVVITHSRSLLDSLHGAKRLLITEGAATWMA